MLKHAKTCDVVDDADPSTVSPSDWNADHVVDETGISFVSATTEPPAPEVGKLTLYARETAGRGMLRIKAPTGVDVVLQPSFLENTIYMVAPNVTSGVTTVGGGSMTSGTITTPSPSATTFGHITHVATNASTSTTCSIEHPAYPYSLNSGIGYAGGFTSVMRLTFPDADYGAGTTGCRWFAGFHNAPAGSGPVANNNPAGSRIGFSYITSLGDQYFMMSAKDGVTENRFSSGMPFQVGKLYDFYLFAKPGATSVGFRIDNLSDGTSVSGQVSSNLPDPTTFMKCGVHMITNTTVARSFRMKKIYVESDI
jgi:hypothetical protein